MTRSLPFRTGFLALLTALSVSIATSQAQSPTTLRKGDALLIRIDRVGGGIPEYREIVDSDGRIELPYLGLLPAAGKSVAALETEMAAAYAEARLGTAPVVRITYVWHFEPAPDRANLHRAEDPRRPVPAAAPPPPAPAP